MLLWKSSEFSDYVNITFILLCKVRDVKNIDFALNNSKLNIMVWLELYFVNLILLKDDGDKNE